MDTTVAAALGLGFVLGLRHALDPDHVVAVSTIVSEQNSLARSSLVGTFWGLGHSASLFAVGLVIVLLRVSIPEHVLPWMEMPVAAMLILLGINAVRRAVRDRGMQIHTHVHEHGDKPTRTSTCMLEKSTITCIACSRLAASRSQSDSSTDSREARR